MKADGKSQWGRQRRRGWRNAKAGGGQGTSAGQSAGPSGGGPESHQRGLPAFPSSLERDEHLSRKLCFTKRKLPAPRRPWSGARAPGPGPGHAHSAAAV